jgi:hypothetical protein
MAKTKLYTTWANMKSRIRRPVGRNVCYEGLTLCEEWEKFKGFEEWALNNGYEEGLTIDRVDNSVGYSPSNCRWVTKKEQQRNKTNTHWITYNGKTQSLASWAEELGMGIDTLKWRIYRGFSIERAFTEPLGTGRSTAMYTKRKRDEKGRVL